MIKKILKKHNKKGYYKGIPCHCCIVGDESLSIYDSFSDKQYLTWANVFVNSNYQDFNNYFSSIVKEREVYLMLLNQHLEEKAREEQRQMR